MTELTVAALFLRDDMTGVNEMKPLNFNKAEFITSYGKLSQIPESDRPEFAFSGRSNVGKSSLINKIFNRKNMARVSSVPGKTVTINFFSVEDVYFVDLLLKLSIACCC